ncbi:MAG: multidrug transporter ATP-binding protein [Neobacillus sp.]|jgi:ABC-2 type transport system ATP-binding protein|nr:multidrug transporter ATP-binding protein [Neobacillus sp.]
MKNFREGGLVMIKVENLSKHFSYYKKEVGLMNSVKNLFSRELLIKKAVDNISFEIEEGEIVGFLGPNGAGKTTTLKMLSGILHPTAGEAKISGFVPWERKKDYKKMFSIIMGQKNQLWWDLPANESLYLNKCIYEINDKDFNDILLDLTDMLDVKEQLGIQVRRLSLGERMKFELIAALLHKPRVIFLDEPTIGLDIISQKKIRDFLKTYNRSNKTTILLTSHYMKDIEDLCKRTIVINQGKVVFDGEPSKINEKVGSKKVMRIQFGDNYSEHSFLPFGSIKEFDGINLSIEVEKNSVGEYLKIILNHFNVLDFTIEDVSIEESIASLYGKEGANELNSQVS